MSVELGAHSAIALAKRRAHMRDDIMLGQIGATVYQREALRRIVTVIEGIASAAATPVRVILCYVMPSLVAR